MITPDASKKIDDLTKSAALRHGVPADGDGRMELASHLHDAATDLAAGETVTVGHVERAWEGLRPQIAALLGSDDGEAAPAKAPLDRFTEPPAPANVHSGAAPWGVRFVAYIADVISLFIPFALLMMSLDAFLFGRWYLIDAFIPLIFIGLGAGYVSFEKFRGASPGKMLLGLRTATESGDVPSWRQAILVSLPKFFPPLLVLDTVVGAIAARNQRQRWTESWAGVRVVRA